MLFLVKFKKNQFYLIYLTQQCSKCYISESIIAKGLKLYQFLDDDDTYTRDDPK